MNKVQKIIIAVIAIIVIGGGAYYFSKSKSKQTNRQISVGGKTETTGPANTGDVSPISGLACSDWNRRPFAVMQPADVSARPAAGFSDADMVVEMPVITASITRLMGVYVCGNPDDVGSMRSSRHDYLALAQGLDAIYVHWGGSHYAIDLIKEGVEKKTVDNINCNNDGGNPGQPDYCYRKEATGTMRGVDTGYAKFAKLIEGAKHYGYRLENKFAGYPHQEEAPEDQRGDDKGHLRVAFAGPFAAEYDYDKASNSYLRTWGNVADTDRNNGKRLAPKNVVVMIAQSGQIVEGEQYNNVQIGDPWYDSNDSGKAYYFMNGQKMEGSWKKDKSKADSKLFFYDGSGAEVKFVPGQVWLEILEPGQTLQWGAEKMNV
ncbi:MAG TPA: DUF3048 domain-containing protein [Candidatus Moranbacteria bacterium]|nr:DUF3048 domain-containing protein [Candidatus Moranbacteria bacterium]